MKTFRIQDPYARFETGGPDGGLITVEGELTTDDPAVIATLTAHGMHALTVDDAAPAAKKSKDVEASKGDES